MRHLFKADERIGRLIGRKKILLMLDYDGTVVPIAKTPDRAVLPERTKRSILSVLKDPGIKLAFISGRSLSEIKKMAAIDGIYYAGNHGLEIEGPGISYVHKKARDLSGELRIIFERLSKKLCDHKGVLIEDKNLSISVHYRLADPTLDKDIISEVTALVDPKKFRLSGGKKVVEIRPKHKWDKGSAVKVLTGKFKGYYPVYLGDDRTDEDAFSAIRNKGLSIFVGPPKKSAAAFRLEDPSEVRSLIEMLGRRKRNNG